MADKERTMDLQRELETLMRKDIKKATDMEIFHGLMALTKAHCEAQYRERERGKRKLYYISAEFLMGKLLSNNLIGLGLYEDVKAMLKENGRNLSDIEEMENEPSLGNGGLGRLAACFLDSIAALGLNGDGVGLNYHYGLFRQTLVHGKQKEEKDAWLTQESWLKDTRTAFKIPFGKFTLDSLMYDIDVPGKDGKVNRLHLFDVLSPNEDLVEEGIAFDKTKIADNLTLFLYPDDSDEKGQLLRIYQQYFMVSSAAQLILKEMDEAHLDVRALDAYAVVQINDTHPSLVIPELIRLLMERGVDLKEATEIVSRTCAYTNHTILAEALEKWPVAYLEEVVPHLMPIIRYLDKQVKDVCSDEKVAIIDASDRVHMAHMDIHYGKSVNGVAALHTEILKTQELKAFYDLYPEKFNNKTNGITFRRWLIHANPFLSDLITEKIGSGWQTDATELEKLLAFKEDKAFLDALLDVKAKNKRILAEDFQKRQNAKINPDAIFDIQVKRLHEYKRQQMNCLYAIYKYLEIKAGKKPKTPIVMVFGAKAAPAYKLAKDIIHLICCLSELTASDRDVKDHFRVVMAENYNVTWAEDIMPAADISEQISLASKEASGTGNMKFMLNGALTLGTMDGANVEIADRVGRDNIYIFGASSEEVIRLYEEGTYSARALYKKSATLRKLVDFIKGPELLKIGDKEALTRVYDDLIGKDWFMALLDTEDYIKTKEKMLSDYEDRYAWAKKMLVNIAMAGFFSSDRTIAEYNKDIWKL